VLLSILATLVALVLLAALIPSSDDESETASTATTTEASQSSAETESTPKPTPRPKPKPTRYGQLLIKGMTPQKAARPICGSYETSIDEWARDGEAYLAATNPLVSDYDSYAAADYVRSSGPYEGRTSKQFEAHIEKLALKRLKAVTRPRLTETMLERFTADSLFVCHLGAAYKETPETLDAAVERSSNIASLAASVPWYPEGWTEHQDGLAWHWLEYGSEYTCDYDGVTCWGIEVMARDGCDSNLYAEVQILDSSGTAVDYTNDTLGSLSPGQTGRLVLNWFGNDGNTSDVQGHLAQLNCY